MYGVGLDIGYAQTKVVWRGSHKIFPSQVGTVAISSFSLSGASDRVVLLAPREVEVGVVQNSRVAWRGEETQEWFKGDTWLTLAMAALAHVRTRKPMRIVTGLPHSFLNEASREFVQDALLGSHRLELLGKPAFTAEVQEVRVIPQSVGVIFDVWLNNNGTPRDKGVRGESIGVIDIGGHTANFELFSKLQVIDRASTTVEIGGWMLVDAVKNHALKWWPSLRMTDWQWSEAVASEKVKVFGREESIADVVSEERQQLAKAIAAEAQTVWRRDVALFDRIIITGGGSTLLGDSLVEALPPAWGNLITKVEDPILANARGFRKFAVMLGE